MGAFAVAISIGLSTKTTGLKQMIIVGGYFGLFQALMPLAGYFLGASFTGKLTGFAHWISFALLGFVGGKMIKDSFTHDDATRYKSGKSPYRFLRMIPLAVATSIDALVVGTIFSLLNTPIFTASVLIGSITFIITSFGVKIGSVFGLSYKAKAEFIGGAVLILLGIKIAIERTLF